MSADIEITYDRTGETMVAQVEGQTDAGTDFIDALHRAEMFVVDSGRVILPEAEIPGLLTDAGAQGLRVEVAA